MGVFITEATNLLCQEKNVIVIIKWDQIIFAIIVT